MKFGLKEDLVKKMQDVFAMVPEIDEAIIYGSRAKGNYRPGSDIDIALKGNHINLSVLNRADLLLDDLDSPYTFDVSIFTRITNPDLVEHINRAGISFYNRDTINNVVPAK